MNETQKSMETSIVKRETPKTTLAVVKSFIENNEIKDRFKAVLKEKAPAFLASVVSLIASDKKWNGVNPNTIMASAMVAATLDLPINQSLGLAYIIPYKDVAQFQIGYKGYVQLALRTGQYKTINATEVYEGELISANRFTGEFVFDQTKKTSNNVIGFYAYFRLINGFEKAAYMTLEEMQAHGKRYSRAYGFLWTSDVLAMGKKTILKLLLAKYGILSTVMQKAVLSDQASFADLDHADQPEYPDAPQIELPESVTYEPVNEEPPAFDGEPELIYETKPKAKK